MNPCNLFKSVGSGKSPIGQIPVDGMYLALSIMNSRKGCRFAAITTFDFLRISSLEFEFYLSIFLRMFIIILVAIIRKERNKKKGEKEGG